MLPILPNFTPIKIDPIIDLFTKINNNETLLSQSDKGDLGFFYIELVFLILTIFITTLVYFCKRKDDKKLAKQKAKEGLCVMLLLVCSSLFTYFTAINPTISKYNEINNLQLETVFSNYNIDRVKSVKNNEKTVIYDASGNKKPETQFKIYLNKTINRNDISKSIYRYLKKSVVINVTKVNKDGFDILLPNGKVVTIKEKDAEQIFNTLNKIKAKESEN
jgi:hypothetical protein